VLFLQFHDSLAGTALPEHYEQARNGQGRAMDVAQQAMYLSAQKLAWQVPALDPESSYLMVFNPHTWNSVQNVEYDLGLSEKDSYAVEDDQGTPIPFQWVQATTAAQGRRRLLAQVSLPAFGYRQIRIRKSPAPSDGLAHPEPTPYLKAGENLLENNSLRVTFSLEGTIGIYDKVAGREVFLGGKTGARAIVFSDQNDTWAHNLVAYTDEIGAFKADSIKLVETGPLRARMRVHSVYGNSSLTIDWILYAGSGRLEARVALDWHEHLKMLKCSFPVDVEAPKATYEIAYGAIERATRGEEEPGQRWVDVSSSAGDYGLAVINDAKYGYSVNRSDLRVSIARGAVYANHMPQKLEPEVDYQWQDQGLQSFRMVLVPHKGLWQDASIVRQAEELVAPSLVTYQGIHAGSLPQSNSFLSVGPSNIVVAAIKMAEEGKGLIVRLYETGGREVRANMNLHFANIHWSGNLGPYEIKTLRVDSVSHQVKEVNIPRTLIRLTSGANATRK
jgi:alpha-mannosidase